MISRALCFYNIAVAVVETQNLSGQRDSEMIPFELALYNNLGHIHGIYSDRDGASTCLYRVKETFALCSTLRLLVFQNRKSSTPSSWPSLPKIVVKN